MDMNTPISRDRAPSDWQQTKPTSEKSTISPGQIPNTNKISADAPEAENIGKIVDQTLIHPTNTSESKEKVPHHAEHQKKDLTGMIGPKILNTIPNLPALPSTPTSISIKSSNISSKSSNISIQSSSDASRIRAESRREKLKSQAAIKEFAIPKESFYSEIKPLYSQLKNVNAQLKDVQTQLAKAENEGDEKAKSALDQKLSGLNQKQKEIQQEFDKMKQKIDNQSKDFDEMEDFFLNTAMPNATSNKGIAEAVTFMLDALSDLDPHLKAQGKGKEIMNEMKTNPKLSDVIKQDPILQAKLEKVENQVAQSIKDRSKDTMKNLLEGFTSKKSPINEKQFLLSYRGGIMSEIIGKKTTNLDDSVHLFKNINETFTTCTIDQKQVLIDLAREWINDPFINANDLKLAEREIKVLITNCIKDETPIIKKLAFSLTDDLQRALLVSSSKAELSTGSVSMKKTVNDVATGKLDPESKKYKQAVKDAAESINAQYISAFNAINSADFREAKWGDNLTRISELSTHISNFVTLSIIEPTNDSTKIFKNAETKEITTDQRAKLQQQSKNVLDFFVEVEKELISKDSKVYNLEGFMAVSAGITSPNVSRFANGNFLSQKGKEATQVHNYNPKTGVTKLGAFEDLANPNLQPARNKMKELKENNITSIPFLGITKKDFAQLKEIPTIDVYVKELNENKIETLGSSLNAISNQQKRLSKLDLKITHDFNEISTIGSSYDADKVNAKSLLIFPRPAKK